MSDRSPDDDRPRERRGSGSDVFDIGRSLVSLVADEQTAQEFEDSFRELAGEPSRQHDASFFSGVGIAERVLEQRRQVRQSSREADPDRNTVPSVRVSQVRDGADGPVQAIAVICSDPDAEFTLKGGSLELYSPKHDYRDPIRVPFDDAVLRVADVADVAEATVIDASELPDATEGFDHQQDPAETADPRRPDSGVTNREPDGKWAANGEDPTEWDDDE